MKKNEFGKLIKENKQTLKMIVSKERDELAGLYRDKSMKKLKNTRKIFHKKKHIARILTIINNQTTL